MKSEAVVMTIDFGRNHFNAILLERQLKLISSKGSIISISDEGHRNVEEQTEQALKKLLGFFKP